MTRLYLLCLVAWGMLFAADTSLHADDSGPSGDSARQQELDGSDFFERRIRPLFVQHCVKCHGSKKQESGLRLDSRVSILKGGDSGSAVSLDEPNNSLLLRVVRHTGDVKMPPDKKLQANEIADLARWIALKAPWGRDTGNGVSQSVAASNHWAFQAVERSQPPTIAGDEWSRSGVDRFVLDRMRSSKLKPAPPADARTLIRRATFDLTGLPPTPTEISEFEAAHATNPRQAFSDMINRLLQSPRYGERWGRYWLDVARYADNKGYVFFEENTFPWAWTYRDYVIRAFNEDLPFDQFVIEQLAADQLELGDDKRALAAMGYLTLGARFMNNAFDVIDDRIDVVTRGLMGLTVTCARCHDHKFDPIPQADYYSLFGVFRSSYQPTVPPEFLPSPKTDEYRKFADGLRQRVAKLSTFLERQRELINKGSRERAAEYIMAVQSRRNHPNTENFMLLTDKGAIIPKIITRWEIYLRETRQRKDPVWSVWHAFADRPEPRAAAPASTTKTPPKSARFALAEIKPGVQINPLVRQAFADKPPHSIQDVAQTYGRLFAKIDKQWQDALRNTAVGVEHPIRLDNPDAEQIRQVLYGRNSPAVIPQELNWGFLDLLPDRPTQGEFKKLVKEVETWSMSGPGAPARAMVLNDSSVPFDPVIFMRGNPNRRGISVPRQFLSAVQGGSREPFQHGSGRLELARAIVDPRNPLTARVLVNRVWQHHFGRGLVDTPSDFGLRSNPPSHPKLLDWLASEFVSKGWSIKSLHRLIMNSAVYQQSSVAESNSVDAENRLLWKYPRRRLDFEAMRDSLLAVSGGLQLTLGGKPLNIDGGYVPRRSVYGFVNRMDLSPLRRAFDFPDPAATSPRREDTTIAPQALFFLNHNFVAECAKRLVARPDVSGVTDNAQRIDRVYRIILGRTADVDEVELARSYLGAKPTPARWQRLAHALLMTNEFLFID